MSGAVTRWWWVRHAPVTADGGCVYGQMDIECDCSDDESFRRLAGWLPREAVLVTSHLQRTTQTARAIAGAGLALAEPIVEPALAEQHFGDWQGQDRARVFAENAEWHQFWLAPAHRSAPGGESFANVVARVGPAIERLTEAHAGRDIIAVAHGGTIRAALCVALGLDPAGALSFAVENLSLTRLDHVDGGVRGRGWRVTVVNQVPDSASAAARYP